MITFAQLEQEVARRTGPYFQAAQDIGAPTTSTTIAAYMPVLKTSALLGGPENLWLLRRGVLTSGAPTPTPIDPADRYRMVQAFDAAAGRVIVDRNWRHPMQPDELADFTHLHPAQELRVAVMAGLRRCFIEETLSSLDATGYASTDLTYLYPWLTSPDQVICLQAGLGQPAGEVPYRTAVKQGHVLLMSGISYPSSSLWLTVLRPAWSLVNELDSIVGPQLDNDLLSVDLDYAASAGHIEAWHLFPAHLFAAAAGNLQSTQEMAAREFTRQALLWGPPPKRSTMFPETVTVPVVNA